MNSWTLIISPLILGRSLVTDICGHGWDIDVAPDNTIYSRDLLVYISFFSYMNIIITKNTLFLTKVKFYIK